MWELLLKSYCLRNIEVKDKIRIYASYDNCTYEMTKREFYDVFSNVVKINSYREVGIYHYAKTPAKTFQFIVNR